MTRENFASGMALLSSTFQVEPDRAMTEAWWVALGDLSDEDWQEGVKRTLRTVETYGRFPYPASLLATLRKTKVEAMTEAQNAWSEVLAAVSHTPRGGAYWSLSKVKDDAGVDAARAFVAIGGSERLEGSDDTGIRIARQEFCKLYAEVSEDPVKALMECGRFVSGGQVRRMIAQTSK